MGIYPLFHLICFNQPIVHFSWVAQPGNQPIISIEECKALAIVSSRIVCSPWSHFLILLLLFDCRIEWWKQISNFTQYSPNLNHWVRKRAQMRNHSIETGSKTKNVSLPCLLPLSLFYLSLFSLRLSALQKRLSIRRPVDDLVNNGIMMSRELSFHSNYTFSTRIYNEKVDLIRSNHELNYFSVSF